MGQSNYLSEIATRGENRLGLDAEHPDPLRLKRDLGLRVIPRESRVVQPVIIQACPFGLLFHHDRVELATCQRCFFYLQAHSDHAPQMLLNKKGQKAVEIHLMRDICDISLILFGNVNICIILMLLVILKQGVEVVIC